MSERRVYRTEIYVCVDCPKFESKDAWCNALQRSINVMPHYDIDPDCPLPREGE